MCCEFGPPDIRVLGPPPKPPGATFNLECAGSSLVVHYDTLPFYSTSRGSSNGSTLNIVAIVLFSLAAVILIVGSIVLWYKRRVMLKNQIGNDVFTEESQFLYNYRAIGKIWKLPRSALMISKNGKCKGDNLTQINQEQTPIYEDPNKLHSDTSLISNNSDTGYYGDQTTQLNMNKALLLARHHTSLDRASSTTSGISSDGDPGSRVLPHADLRHAHSLIHRQSKPDMSHPRYDSGDVDSSIECLPEAENTGYQQMRQTSVHYRTLPPVPPHAPPKVSPHTLARFRTELCKDTVTPRLLYVTPKDDSNCGSPRPLPELPLQQRSQYLPQYESGPYARENERHYEEYDVLGRVHQREVLEPSVAPAVRDTERHSQRRRKKRRSRGESHDSYGSSMGRSRGESHDSYGSSMGRSRGGSRNSRHNSVERSRGRSHDSYYGSVDRSCSGSRDLHEWEIEKRHNAENEFRESYA